LHSLPHLPPYPPTCTQILDAQSLPTASITSRGSLPSTLHPTETAVPKISLQPFARSFAQLRGRITRAISMISDIVTLPVCLIFFSFLRSRGGSFRALMTSAAAEGMTEIFAWRFWTVNLTVIRRPFQSLAVSLAISSPIFLGDRPRGPILGAREEAAPTSPPVTRTQTSTTSLGSNLGGMVLK
ncbi:hypothetical protein Vafri_3623, partial [Volvox africanus]